MGRLDFGRWLSRQSGVELADEYASAAEGRAEHVKITDIQRRILEAAWRAGGQYRLQARRSAIEAKLEREACESFVSGDYARWISLGQTPGIVFTDKALRLQQPRKPNEPT